MKKFAIVLMLLTLALLIVPCFADTPSPAEDDTSADVESIIGGADGPTAISVAVPSNSNFHPENFVSNLSYMGIGMVGIFIVIGIIILATALLNKIFRTKSED